MSWLKQLLSRVFKRKSAWDGLPYGTPAKSEDELSRLNGER